VPTLGTLGAIYAGGLELDHVLIAVSDLGAAGRELEARHGLASIDGGRHPGWGTANRIVPLADAYLELVAVVDDAEAGQSTFGRWVARAAPAPAMLFGWAVRTDDLDQVARRLGLEVAAGSRATRGGRLLEWRMAGVAQAAAEPSFPFFIEWGQSTPLPGRTALTHRTAGARIAELNLEGDADRLAAWLGRHRLPITVRPGTPRLRSVVLTVTAGEIVLDDRL
jgi:Glyoxalase-like domain